MTNVVIQDVSYCLRDEFWQETRDAGFKPFVVEFINGQFTVREITRDEFASQFHGRIAGWVRSETKSMSVFREALGTPSRILWNQDYQNETIEGLKAVAPEFTARTGAQGKIRLPAHARFYVFIQDRAKDGSPQLHVHIVIGDRVRVQDQDKEYATHKRELYQLRKLFDATTSHNLGHKLHKDWGVQVKKTKLGIVLPEVPKTLCQRSSVRTQQINDYIKRHNLKNSPLTRKYAAIVTRRENQDPRNGLMAFENELKQSGFRSTQIMKMDSHTQRVDSKRPTIQEESKRIAREAKSLTRVQKTVSSNDLLAKALETADVRQKTSFVKRAAQKVLRSSKQYGLRCRINEYGKSVLVSRQTAKQWKKLKAKIDFILKDKQSKHDQSEHQQKRAKTEAGHTSQNSKKQTRDETGADQTRQQSADFRRVVEKALRSYRVIGAIGQTGFKAAEVAVDLYQTWAKPIWRVHGNGHKNMPGSVAKMVRDLKPLGMIDSHKAAIMAMLKLNGTLEQKLRYGEFVYRQSRKAKFRIPRKSLIVVRDAGTANPKDLNYLLRKAERAKAKTIFVEQEHSRLALRRMAKSMKPGENRHFQSQEMSR